MKDWEKYLDYLLDKFHKKIFTRINEFLDGVKNIVFIPYSYFHLLPLHAMYFEEHGRRHYIVDQYRVSYAPSFNTLYACNKNLNLNKEKAFLCSSNPPNTDPLLFSYEEVKSIKTLFKHPNIKNQARWKDIIDGLKDCNIFHYSGHATHDSFIVHDEVDKNKSENKSFNDVVNDFDLSNSFLATMSACEVGMIKLQNNYADEYIGINSALIYAGAPTVISSLWPVQDNSTCLLMRKMYEYLIAGKGKAEALTKAQRWLKDPKNKKQHIEMLNIDWVHEQPNIDFSRPYFWAGFFCLGSP